MKREELNVRGDTWKRTVAKAITYRIAILILDFSAIYLFTGRYDVALGFTVLSNVYTSIVFVLHERGWNRIRWGMYTAALPEHVSERISP
jgi:uncharacterized membrane protein